MTEILDRYFSRHYGAASVHEQSNTPRERLPPQRLNEFLTMSAVTVPPALLTRTDEVIE